MKKIFLSLFVSASIFSFAQKNNNTIIAFWNIENLYDTINDPTIDDEEWLPTAKSNWNSERYVKKLGNISSIISKIGVEQNTDGAAIIGLAEIENKSVLEDLVKMPKINSRKYEIVQYNSPDKRGIDVAFLYNPKYFTLSSSSVHTVKLPGDSALPTRDQLLVNGKLNGELVHILVCHWPSRRGGEEESKINRITAAKVAKGIVDSIRSAEKNAKIIVMGDLNDDPKDESIKNTLVTSEDANKSDKKTMFNPMETILAGGQGTLSHKGKWNLFDQIIITESIAKKQKGNYYFKSAHINNYPEVQETNPKYLGQPFRTYAGSKYLGGYSDHFGVYIVLTK